VPLFDRNTSALMLIAGLFAALSGHLILISPFSTCILIIGFAVFIRAISLTNTIKHAFLVGSTFGTGFIFGSLFWLSDVLSLLSTPEQLLGGAILSCFALIAVLPFILTSLTIILLRKYLSLHALVLFPVILILSQSLFHEGVLNFPWFLYGHWLALSPFDTVQASLGSKWSGILILNIAVCLSSVSYKPPHKGLYNELAKLFPTLICTVLCVSLYIKKIPVGASQELSVELVQFDHPVIEDRQFDDLEILAKYVLASNASSADIVIWPESVIRQGSSVVEPLANLLGTDHKVILAGALFEQEGVKQNVLMDIKRNHILYVKRKLIPFSEYLPHPFFKALFSTFQTSTLKSTIQAGNAKQAPINVRGISMSPLICYEALFSELVDPSAQLILNLGNESWFQSPITSNMMLSINISRAIEHDIPLLRISDQGLSGFFDPAKHSFFKAKNNSSQQFKLTIPVHKKIPSQYSMNLIIGLIQLLLSCLVTLLAITRDN